MNQITPTDGRLDSKHFTHHRTDAFREKHNAARQQEEARQALLRGENTPEALAYARFLNAVENDATLSQGTSRPFLHNDEEVARNWPSLFLTEKEDT